MVNFIQILAVLALIFLRLPAITVTAGSEDQAPVVQKVDNAIHWINHHPVDSVVCFVNIYPLDSDLSGG